VNLLGPNPDIAISGLYQIGVSAGNAEISAFDGYRAVNEEIASRVCRWQNNDENPFAAKCSIMDGKMNFTAGPNVAFGMGGRINGV